MSLESSGDRHIFSIFRLRRKSTSTDTEQLLMIPTHFTTVRRCPTSLLRWCRDRTLKAHSSQMTEVL